MADFAAAQTRILERRAARSQALAAAESSSPPPANALNLPPALRSLLHLPTLYGTSPAYRVGQVDAELLDSALLGLLKTQASNALKLYGAHLKDDWDPEITLALRTILWKLSIWDHGASYGASLQGLKYIDARRSAVEGREKEASGWQRAVYGLVTVGGRYGWTRWEEMLSSRESGYEETSSDRLWRWMGKVTTGVESGYNIAAFASFLVFLYNGRYRTLTDRLLRLRLVPASNQTSREVSFEYLNRQLVWHAFTEFLLFLLPLVGISRWRRWISRAWKKAKIYISQLRNGTSLEDEDEDEKTGELAFLPERTCAICYSDQNTPGATSEQDAVTGGQNSGIIGSAMTDITNPYETDPCACVYCFVCLAQKIEAEEGEGWMCLRCGTLVKECRPWSGDVVTEKRSSSRSRSGTGVLRSSSGSGSPQSLRRKSVMFDLDDEERKEREEEVEMEEVDPMPIEEGEESVTWSRVEGDEEEDGYGLESYDEAER